MGRPDKKKLYFVIPLANESETLKQFYEAIVKVISPYENRLAVKIFFVVDHASIDNTRDIVESLEKDDRRVSLVWSPENKNVVDAYVAGFRTALKSGADYVLEMDGGFSHLPEEIPLFIEKLLQGYDCVFGSRFVEAGGLEMSLKRLILSKGGTLASNILLGMKMKDTTSGFEGFKAAVLGDILSRELVSTGHFIQTEIRFRARNSNYIEVPIHYANASKRVSLQSILNSLWGLTVCFAERLVGVKYG
jgi:dolichol-phosphate mannosyltransferase